jgi:hypothetical protein
MTSYYYYYLKLLCSVNDLPVKFGTAYRDFAITHAAVEP